MNQYKKEVKLGFDNQKEQAFASLQELVAAFEPELERLKEGLEAMDEHPNFEFPQQSLSFGS